MIRIVTIEREYGSGGSAIAQKLAERLNWKLIDRSLTEDIARLAKVDRATAERIDEHCDPLLYRLAKVFLRGSFERSLPVSGLEHFDAGQMVALVERVIEEAASLGQCVIVGRGAPCVLRHRQDAFHVFLYAPLEERIRRLLAKGKQESEAFELVTTIDKERAAFLKRYFNAEWPNRHLYHLMINTKVGDELVIDLIVNEIAMLDKKFADVTPKA